MGTIPHLSYSDAQRLLTLAGNGEINPAVFYTVAKSTVIQPLVNDAIGLSFCGIRIATLRCEDEVSLDAPLLFLHYTIQNRINRVLAPINHRILNREGVPLIVDEDNHPIHYRQGLVLVRQRRTS